MAYAVFDGSFTTATATGAYLHDYGQKLTVVGLDLPAVVEAHFSLDRQGQSVLSAGTCERGVTTIPIPDAMLEEKGSFYCYIFGRSSASGRTQYEIKIPVTGRADLPGETVEPTGDDLNYFSQVMEDVAESAAQAQAAKEELISGISIGTVETLEAGTEATASITDNEGSLALNLGIPKGEQGIAGESDALCVTITVPGSNQAPVADKTYAEIQAALKQGKRVYAYAPKAQYIFSVYPDRPIEPDTVYELFWPFKGTTVNGTTKRYAFFGYTGIFADNKLPLSLDDDFNIMVEGYAIFNDGTVENRQMKIPAGNRFQKKLLFDDAPTEDSTNPVTSGGVYSALQSAGSYKVTVKLEIGNDAYGEADASYADVKAAIDAGKYVYLEARFYTNRQDESSYAYSVRCPLSYETDIENDEMIVFRYEAIYDFGSSYNSARVYSFEVSFLAGNSLVIVFPDYSAELVKKSAYDALEQRVAALEQVINI